MPAVAKQVRVPELRFPRYEEELCSFRLGELMDFRNGMNISREDYSGDVPLVNVVDVLKPEGIIAARVERMVQADTDSIARFGLKFGDLLFQRSSETREEVGSSNVYLDDSVYVYGGFVIRGRPVTSFSSLFLNYQLKLRRHRFRISRLSGGSTRYNIGQESLSALGVLFPRLEEQEKIAGFLTAVDERIGKLKRKKELLEEYKRGMMQKLFSQEVRFKDEHGRHYPDWEELKLCDVAKKSNLKNKENEELPVLTNSATRGIVAQDSYFDREITTDSNLDGYYIVKEGAFVYNPRISKPAPAGPINRNEVMLGLMSPLYTVFHVDGGVADFLALYFKSTLWFRYIMAVSNIGARHDRMNVSVDDFFRMPTPMPSAPERAKIAEFLTGLDDKLANLGRRIEKAEEFKRGLLQKMFV